MAGSHRILFGFHNSIYYSLESFLFHNSEMRNILLWVDMKSKILEGWTLYAFNCCAQCVAMWNKYHMQAR